MESYLYSYLEPYINKKANILVSGGSLLTLFNTAEFKQLGKQKDWQIYFSDERYGDETNIEDAKKYMSKFCDNFNDLRLKKITVCDIAILSVGEDGHIASLFPNHPALNSKDKIININDSPKEPRKRITVGIEYLNSLKKLIFMIPKKNGVVKNVYGPHKSICDKLKVQYSVYLDASLSDYRDD
ncbi:hypothetical protein BDAP_001367 [Binucleata daphniae]